ncbi:hypothetical protein XENOCAPTIV_005972, partial [Xenoophorus captivus]
MKWTSQQDAVVSPRQTTKLEAGEDRQHKYCTPQTPPIKTDPAHYASSLCLSVGAHAPQYKRCSHSRAEQLATPMQTLALGVLKEC